MNLPFPDVQVAGIRNWDEAERLIDCGIKFLGFPLRLPVNKEDITEEEARKIIGRLPAGVFGVLITYLDTAESIIELSDYLSVKHIQLHGPIDFDELAKFKKAKPKSFVVKLPPAQPEAYWMTPSKGSRKRPRRYYRPNRN